MAVRERTYPALLRRTIGWYAAAAAAWIGAAAAFFAGLGGLSEPGSSGIFLILVSIPAVAVAKGCTAAASDCRGKLAFAKLLDGLHGALNAVVDATQTELDVQRSARRLVTDMLGPDIELGPGEVAQSARLLELREYANGSTEGVDRLSLTLAIDMVDTTLTLAGRLDELACWPTRAALWNAVREFAATRVGGPEPPASVDLVRPDGTVLRVPRPPSIH